MTTGSYYKQTSRTQRIIRTEADYSKGMLYINTPLDTGYSRIILNLDLAENGTGLKPRPGLRTYAETVYPEGSVVAGPTGLYTSPSVYCKANSVMRRESDGAVKYTDTVIVGEDVYKVGPYIEDSAERTISRLTNSTLRFNKDKAHCFAWQGQLYHMHEDGLYHFNDTYAHAQIEPKVLSPKEAVTNGYNMLATDPYEFYNTPSVATSGDILGILPYAVNKDDNGNTSIGDLALNAAPNTPMCLKVILSVVDSEDVKYQCRLQWRESTQGSWEDIQLEDSRLKWDEESTDGVPGSELLASEGGEKVSIYSKEWNKPTTNNGLPIYVRAMLRVASENSTLYKIGGASNISVGTVLGAGTAIGNLTECGLQFRILPGAQTNFTTPLKCYVSADAEIKEGTYISHLYCEDVRSSLAAVGIPGFTYNGNEENPYWSSSGIDSFIDAYGVQHSVDDYILKCLYKNRNDTTPITEISELTSEMWFKLQPNETMFWSVNDISFGQTYLHHSGFLKGSAIIPVRFTFDLLGNTGLHRMLFDLQIDTFAEKGVHNWVNLYAVKDYEQGTAQTYTIGAGTTFIEGSFDEEDYSADYLNNTEVYNTTTLTEPIVVGADDPVATKTAASDIAPVTSVVSFVFKPNSKLGAVLNYDLDTAKGMCFWQNRLVLWGVNTPEGADRAYQDDSANLLFFSEVNDPSYFPYPQCVSAFTEPVLRALPFGDDLLVITATSMHLIGLNEDGISWTSVQIQSNLRFREDEMRLVHVVNNMVLFKSGPQFYLLVPSTVNVGNLVVAPITQNIKSIFDNPENFIKRLFVALSSRDEELLDAELSATDWFLNTFVDFEHIHITYTASIPCAYPGPGQATVDFMYNTSTRVWKVYLYTTTPGHTLLRKDAVKSGVYISILNNKASELTLQYRRFDSTDITDYIEGMQDFYSNLHFLDTGLRNQDNAYNKRYREAQLKLSNHTTNNLTFYTEYSLDGVVYLPLYAPSLIKDTTDVVDVNYTLHEPLEVPGVAVLEGDVNTTTITEDDVPILVGYNHTGADDVYAFYLEAGHESRFEAPFTIKLRSTILGKGYAPSLKVYSKNTTDFTILDHTWVYRLMNAR